MTQCPGPGCHRPVFCRGLCQTQYKQQRGGRALTLIRSQFARAIATECRVGGCEDLGNEDGFCNMHYARIKRTGDAHIVRQIATARFNECVVVNCHDKVRSNNLCSAHSSRARRFSLTDMQLSQLLLQDCCSACGYKGDDLQIDHDHSCCSGKKSCGRCIRGMLCTGCNWALGNVGDSIERLEGLVIYLKNK